MTEEFDGWRWSNYFNIVTRRQDSYVYQFCHQSSEWQPAFRAKGIINLLERPDYPVILQSTGSRATLTVGEAWGEREPVTQIVFIGSQGGVDSQWLEEHLEGKTASM